MFLDFNHTHCQGGAGFRNALRFWGFSKIGEIAAVYTGLVSVVCQVGKYILRSIVYTEYLYY